jgi:hypothetical protein
MLCPYGMLLRQGASGSRKREQAPALQRNGATLNLEIGGRESQKGRRDAVATKGGLAWSADFAGILHAVPLRSLGNCWRVAERSRKSKEPAGRRRYERRSRCFAEVDGKQRLAGRGFSGHSMLCPYGTLIRRGTRCVYLGLGAAPTVTRRDLGMKKKARRAPNRRSAAIMYRETEGLDETCFDQMGMLGPK